MIERRGPQPPKTPRRESPKKESFGELASSVIQRSIWVSEGHKLESFVTKDARCRAPPLPSSEGFSTRAQHIAARPLRCSPPLCQDSSLATNMAPSIGAVTESLSSVCHENHQPLTSPRSPMRHFQVFRSNHSHAEESADSRSTETTRSRPHRMDEAGRYCSLTTGSPIVKRVLREAATESSVDETPSSTTLLPLPPQTSDRPATANKFLRGSHAPHDVRRSMQFLSAVTLLRTQNHRTSSACGSKQPSAVELPLTSASAFSLSPPASTGLTMTGDGPVQLTQLFAAKKVASLWAAGARRRSSVSSNTLVQATNLGSEPFSEGTPPGSEPFVMLIERTATPRSSELRSPQVSHAAPSFSDAPDLVFDQLPKKQRPSLRKPSLGSASSRRSSATSSVFHVAPSSLFATVSTTAARMPHSRFLANEAAHITPSTTRMVLDVGSDEPTGPLAAMQRLVGCLRTYTDRLAASLNAMRDRAESGLTAATMQQHGGSDHKWELPAAGSRAHVQLMELAALIPTCLPTLSLQYWDFTIASDRGRSMEEAIADAFCKLHDAITKSQEFLRLSRLTSIEADRGTNVKYSWAHGRRVALEVELFSCQLRGTSFSLLPLSFAHGPTVEGTPCSSFALEKLTVSHCTWRESSRFGLQSVLRASGWSLRSLELRGVTLTRDLLRTINSTFLMSAEAGSASDKGLLKPTACEGEGRTLTFANCKGWSTSCNEDESVADHRSNNAKAVAVTDKPNFAVLTACDDSGNEVTTPRNATSDAAPLQSASNHDGRDVRDDDAHRSLQHLLLSALRRAACPGGVQRLRLQGVPLPPSSGLLLLKAVSDVNGPKICEVTLESCHFVTPRFLATLQRALDEARARRKS